ncbi:PilZ domain-containing protein [Azonexus sp.]|uniref:PilZ domain-containing protein n=1 Tax=Azonexus sp. TaxID=1872668 RepID=UPI0039E63EE2
MIEQRKHQRIRFSEPPRVQIGFAGQSGVGSLENLSISGLMLRTDVPLTTHGTAGCEFSLFGSPVVDVAVSILNCLGDLYGARFRIGLINPVLIEDAMREALVSGKASALSVHDLGGRKVMRISGGLNGSLRSDFMHAITRVGIDHIDLSGVSQIDSAGLSLCLVATEHHGAVISEHSACSEKAWQDTQKPG